MSSRVHGATAPSCASQFLVFAAPHHAQIATDSERTIQLRRDFWLMVGLSRFQSKVAIKMIATQSTTRKPLKSQRLFCLPCSCSLPHILPVPVLKIVQPGGKEAAYSARTAVFSVSIGAGREETSLVRRMRASSEHHATLPGFYALDNHPATIAIH